MTNKEQLRQECLTARRGLPEADAATKSQAIVKQLLEWGLLAHTMGTYLCPEPLRRGIATETVLSYVDSKDNEVATRPLINQLLNAGKTVLVPVAENEGVLSWSQLFDLDELRPARFGIYEPAAEYQRRVVPPANALVLAPGVGFTPRCERIGYGGGYYDRFLANHSGLVVALAFDCQIVEAFELHEHDRPVDVVVTESRYYLRPGLAGTDE